ncbi:MAG: uracil-DNA glycosylase [Anaerolineae bacterium]
MSEPANNLTDLTAQIKVCKRCVLAQGRIQAVPGEGPATARIMFIGEGPGQQEDRQGRPFVGPSGQYLNELLALIGLKREDVFIANVVKCRPPGNRDPQPDEIEACRAWLDKQIELIKPRVIVTISRFAMARWFPNKKISEIHGKAFRFGDLVLVAMFHPAAALHNPKLKPVMEEDFKKLPDYINNPGKIPSGDGSKPKDTPPPEQLKMF